MSISSSTNRNDYVGNGATDTYNYTFRIFDEGDLEVTVRDTSDVETTLALSTDYTVTGVGSSGGGTIVLVNSAQSWLDGDGDLKSSYALTIRRVLDLVQETDIRNQGAFYPEIHEDQFDKLVMIAQQQQDELSRSASMPVTVAASAFSPEFPASLPSNPGATIIVNDAGTGFELGPTADQISSANADATAAAASAAAALVSETNAGVSETNAAASAAAAAAVIAGLTASRAVVTNGSGTLASASTTATEIGYVSGVTSAIQTQLDAKAPSASPTLTTPSMDVITLDGQSSTPASPSSGFYKMYVKDATNKFTILDSSGNETSVGAGGGGINLITNGDAESGTTGWSTYADSGSRPTDGTGGSPNVTFTTSSTTPLYGANSFLFTKDAANRQGQGASFTFSVQPAHQAKVLNISFDYIVSSGTFVAGTSSTDSDIIAYIYDVTNGQLIEPSSIKLLSNSSSIADRFNASFQTSATGTSYRLILHCASTSASAYVVKFDNISVGPSEYVYGTPITDWQDYSLTIGAVTTAPTQGAGATKTAKFRRIGDSIEIHFNYFQTAAGSAGSGTYLLPLPTGFTIDTSKITVTTNSNSVGGNTLGNGSISSTTTQNSSTACPLIVTAYNTTNLQLARVTPATSSLNMWGSGDLTMATNPLYVSFKATIPCVGLSSSVQMSDQQDTRVCSMLAYKNAGSATANTDISSWTAVSKDSHGAFNSSTGVYTVPVAGDYYVDFNWEATVSGTVSSSILINNTIVMTAAEGNDSNADYGVSMLLTDLKVGDLITVQSNTTKTLSSSNVKNKLAIFRLSGPNQIAATELIAASYYCSTNQAGTTSAPFNFDTKEYDTHGAVTTGVSWKFTTPSAGVFEVLGYIEKVTATTSGFDIYKNGSAYKRASASLSSGVTYSNIYASLRLNAGDYIELRPSASITIYGGSLTSASHIAIKRIGL